MPLIDVQYDCLEKMVELFYATEVYVPNHLFNPMKELLTKMAVDDLNVFTSESAVIDTFRLPDTVSVKMVNQPKPVVLNPAKRMRASSSNDAAAVKLSSMGVSMKAVGAANPPVMIKPMPIKAVPPKQLVQKQLAMPQAVPKQMMPKPSNVASSVEHPMQSNKKGPNAANLNVAANARAGPSNQMDSVDLTQSARSNQKPVVTANEPNPSMASNQATQSMSSMPPNQAPQSIPSNQPNSSMALQQSKSSIQAHQSNASHAPAHTKSSTSTANVSENTFLLLTFLSFARFFVFSIYWN